MQITKEENGLYIIEAEKGYLLKNLKNLLQYPSIITNNLEKAQQDYIEVAANESV